MSDPRRGTRLSVQQVFTMSPRDLDGHYLADRWHSDLLFPLVHDGRTLRVLSRDGEGRDLGHSQAFIFEQVSAAKWEIWTRALPKAPVNLTLLKEIIS